VIGLCSVLLKPACAQDVASRATALCRTWEAHIKEHTGFQVTIAQKVHRNFCDAITQLCQPQSTVAVPDWLVSPGECIAIAVYHLLGISDEQKAALQAVPNSTDISLQMSHSCVRCVFHA
jgi:hypothetical protein